MDEETFATDTNAFVWYLEGNAKLSKNARLCFEKVERGEAILFIPIIVLFECLDKIARKGFPFTTIDEVLIRIEAKSENFKIAPLDETVFDKGLNLSSSTVKSRDLMIVAVALANEAKLITSDKKVRESGLVETIW